MGLTACRIESTPERFIDQQPPVVDEISLTEAEIRNRLAAVPGALQEGSSSDLLNALAPHADGIILGPVAQSPVPAEQLGMLLQETAAGRRWALQDLVVKVDSTNNVAWFLSRFVPVDQGLPPDTVTPGFDFSGVFTKETGEWRLIQGHLSRTLISTPPPLQGPPR